MSSKIKYSSTILAPISIGELIDKITILEIKQIYMTGTKLKNINKEMKLLKNILQDKNLEINIDLIKNLKKINKKLWEIEDNIRIKESKQEFDEEFIKEFSFIDLFPLFSSSKTLVNLDKINLD